ncbi:MAG: hypothetical protein DCF12_16700 [Snowella sp.]|nr:MAG: hypothetical protein DCF12_16700 [Snowella sp.]
MRDDLKGLEILQSEFNELTGTSRIDLEKGTLKEFVHTEKKENSFTNFLGVFLVMAMILWLIGLGCSKLFNIGLGFVGIEGEPYSYNITNGLIIFGFSFLCALGANSGTSSNNSADRSKPNNDNDYLNSVLRLVSEIKAYNSVIRSMDVNDQLVELGSGKPFNPEDRAKAMDVLKLTRKDIINSLKIKKVLRDNNIQDPSSLFDSNFANIEAIQIQEKATEISSIIGEALKVSIGVQEEMRKITQSQSSDD